MHRTNEENANVEGKKPVRRIEHFWLCGPCAATMKLTLEGQRRVIVVPSSAMESTRRAAAS
jgi:hypothetical protein